MNKEDVEYLLTDDSFIRWISKRANSTEEETWNHWLEEDPARIQKVQEAKRLYHSLQFEEEIPNTIDDLNRLRDAVSKHEEYSQAFSNKKYHLLSKVIAIVLFALPLVWVYSTLQTTETEQQEVVVEYTTVTTDYGQLKNLSFPDGSSITLNANSTLSYPSLLSQGDIKMKLDGEAYFHVSSIETEDRKRIFSVQTPDGNVSVLGTRFNISTRKNHTEVVLEEGKVFFEATVDSTHSETEDLSYTMSPGELITYGLNKQPFEIKHVNTESFTSWRNLELRFDNTPLWKIADRIEQTYGLDVVFADINLRNMEFSGTAPNKNLSVLLEGLRALIDKPITQKTNQIIIGE